MLRDRVIWITGASSGIGAALAEEAALAGMKLILSARNREKLKETAERCRTYGTDPGILPFDLRSSVEIHRALREALKVYGKLDILVQNAGISQRSPGLETDFSVEEQILQTNLEAPILLSKLAAPYLSVAGEGMIVAVSSLAALVPSPLRAAYSASKAGLNAYFSCLRMEASQKSIHFCIVIPGFVQTDISRHALLSRGEQYGKKDKAQERGMDARKCAREILKAIRKRKDKAFVAMGLKGWTALLVSKLFPRIFRRLMKRNGQ